MIDEEGEIEQRPEPTGRSDAEEGRLYDFAKFVTTLALLALGGVLTLTQTAHQRLASPVLLAAVIGSIAAAGTLAVSAAAGLAKVGTRGGRVRLNPRHVLTVAEAMLGIGAGGFLMLLLKTL